MQLRGGFQLVVLSGKTPGRVLNFKKKPGEGFIQGRVFPTATPAKGHHGILFPQEPASMFINVNHGRLYVRNCNGKECQYCDLLTGACTEGKTTNPAACPPVM